MSDKATDHPCTVCGNPAVRWIPEASVQDHVEILEHVRRVHLHIDHKPYCKECVDNWRQAKIKK
jgi:hypothetical protein